MTPYNGIESIFYVGIALAVIVAGVSLFYALKVEKKEKANQGEIADKFRYRKYGIFAIFATAVIGGLLLGFTANGISLKHYQKDIISSIESHNVELIEGFIDPDQPLRAEKFAKFVISSENGNQRCRATAADAKTEISFMCQDADKKFTVPLADVNK